jgi:hypothetical protein
LHPCKSNQDYLWLAQLYGSDNLLSEIVGVFKPDELKEYISLQVALLASMSRYEQAFQKKF